MNDSIASLDPVAPPSPARYDALGWLFALGGLATAAVLGLLSDGIYMNDDATHYFIARDAWGDLSALLHRWGRIGYTAPTSPIAYWLGFAGCRLFSAVQTALISLLAWRMARRLIGPGVFAASAALFVWLQPLTFRLALTTLTETTGALYMLLGLWLYLRGNRLWSCVAFSALFLTRDETLALGPLVALAMVLDARRQAGGSLRKALATGWVWAGFGLLAAGPVLYVLASIPVELSPDGDPLRIFSREWSVEYGTGPLYWMAARWPEQAAPTIVAVGLVGLCLLVRSLCRRQPLAEQTPPTSGTWLVPAWTIAYFALHSVLFSRGLFAHGGEGRYMIPLTGLLAVQAAIGLRGILTDRRGGVVLLFAALLATFICLPFLVFPYVATVLSAATRYGLMLGSLGAVVLVALLVARRLVPPRAVAAVLVVAGAGLLLSQFQFYCRPLSLDNPVDPMDKPLAQAARYVKQRDFSDRVLITKHPLIRFLLPEAELRLPETKLQWSNLEAIALWQQSPPGTIFFWDSKNCNWPDPKEQKTNRQLREMLEAEATELARFITDDWQPGNKCEVIIFEKHAPPIH